MEKLILDILKKSLYIAAVAAAILVWLGYLFILPGIIMGMALALTNLLFLSRDASFVIHPEDRPVKRIVRNFFIRYSVLAVLLAAYCGYAGGSILSCFIGLALVQISVMWVGADKATFESK